MVLAVDLEVVVGNGLVVLVDTHMEMVGKVLVGNLVRVQDTSQEDRHMVA
jgi:hypothetical protein